MVFKKIMITNRGECAVRVEHTCREMGISTIALYNEEDIHSLHVRLADECHLFRCPDPSTDAQAILKLAVEKGVDAIHPGYGVPQGQLDLLRACSLDGTAFIGPAYEISKTADCQAEILSLARSVGFPATECLPLPCDESSFSRDGTRRWHWIGVTVIADRQDHLACLGEHESLLQDNGQRLFVESPSPALSPETRASIHQTALDLARFFHLDHLGLIEFAVDETGQYYFTGMRVGLQPEHCVAEMLLRIDLVREQIRIAAGESLSFGQSELQAQGWVVMAYVYLDPSATDGALPSFSRIYLPSGPDVRVDTSIYAGYTLPYDYDPLVAKVVSWGRDRTDCLARIRRALLEMRLIGVSTNLTSLHELISIPGFMQGIYDAGLLSQQVKEDQESQDHLRDLAAAAAILYLQRSQKIQPVLSERLLNGWHLNNRIPPQWLYSGLAYGNTGSED